MGGRKRTQDDTSEGLTPQQLTAVDVLVSGKTISEAAEAIGVGRPALSEWVNHHPGFIAALNSRRQELWADLTDGLRALAPKALAVLAQELDGPTPLPAALAILKSCGLASANLRPIGPTTPAAAASELRQREVERAASAITEEDVAHAQRKREQDRMMQELLL